MAVYLGMGPDPYSVMMDNGAKINLIHTTLTTKLGLAVTALNHRHLASVNKLKIKFAGIAENTPVSVGGLQYKVPFFIVDGPVSQECILGQLFEMQALVRY